jgi:hypothetical protein
MVRSNRQERPVREEEFDSMPDRIGQHFDRIRELLARAGEEDDSDA